MTRSVTGPHQQLALTTPKERFCALLLDTLWERYRQRVRYVQIYEQIIQQANARFFNDHIALRTLATQQPLAGIAMISRIFEALGYEAAGCYHFPDKHLAALHFQHPHPEFPKLFISELRVWELPGPAQAIVERVLRSHRPPFPTGLLATLARLDAQPVPPDDLLPRVVAEFEQLPWLLPSRQDVLQLNEVSQYAAWVLVHGYNVNHFTSLVNSHGVPELDDIEKTAAALRRAGVPMKDEIEGAPGSPLRQTATQAVVIDVPVHDQGAPSQMPWTYAYFELAQRDPYIDPQTGKKVRFEGFLGPQATHLFEMTRLPGAS